jgi:hypothetical protein
MSTADREAAEPLCLTCGAPMLDPMAGCCHECGAEDKWIGSQWLSMPRDLRPLHAVTGPEERLRESAQAVSDHLDALASATAHRIGCECSGSNDGIHSCRSLGEARAALRRALGDSR